MKIKTIEEYRRRISRQPVPPKGTIAGDERYFIAGFVGAAESAEAPTKEKSKTAEVRSTVSD